VIAQLSVYVLPSTVIDAETTALPASSPAVQSPLVLTVTALSDDVHVTDASAGTVTTAS
jgi:hypothetical protein